MTLPDKLLANFEAQFLAGADHRWNAFPDDISMSNRFNSSPYLISYTLFKKVFCLNEHRRSLVVTLDELCVTMIAENHPPSFALIGGSFANTHISFPNDIDTVLFYLGVATRQSIKKISIKLTEGRLLGLDCTIHPAECSPILVAKLAAFYASLFLQERAPNPKPKAAILVDFEDFPYTLGSEQKEPLYA